MRLSSRRDWRRGGWALGAGLDLRFCRGGLRSVCARCLCVPAGIACSFVMSGRGADLLGDAVSVVAFCPPFTPAVCASLSALCIRLPCRDAELVCGAMRFLSPRLGFGLSLSLRLCRGALPSFMPVLAVLSGRFALGSRLSFFLCQEKRDGLRYLAFLFRRVEIAIRAFSRCWRGYLPLLVHFGLGRFFMAISTGYRGHGATRKRGWRRGLCTSLRCRIGLASLSAGSTLGLRAPDCAKESSTLWTLFTLRRGCVGAYTRRHPGTRKDLTGSNLWPVRSCCIAMLSTRSIVQTRAALKRRGVGLRARSGEEAALRLAGRVGLYSDHINTHNRRPA